MGEKVWGRWDTITPPPKISSWHCLEFINQETRFKYITSNVERQIKELNLAASVSSVWGVKRDSEGSIVFHKTFRVYFIEMYLIQHGISSRCMDFRFLNLKICKYAHVLTLQMKTIIIHFKRTNLELGAFIREAILTLRSWF